MPEHDRDRQDDQHGATEQGPRASRAARPDRAYSRAARGRRRARRPPGRATSDLGDRQQRGPGRAIRGRTRLKSSAPMAIPIRNIAEDDREDVRRVAGARTRAAASRSPGSRATSARRRRRSRARAGPRVRVAARGGRVGDVGRPRRRGRRRGLASAGRSSPRARHRPRSGRRSREHPAPTTSAPDRPKSSIRTRPAASVPTIAPIVFAA